MDRRTVIIAITFFVLIVVGMFAYAYMKRTELERAEQTPAPIEEQDEQGPYSYIEQIDAKHFFEDGTHTLVGEIAMPTPCDLIDPQPIVAESFPEQVTVDFNVINNAESCIQTITPQRFSVSFQASEDASIRAELDGREVGLNLIPPAEGESPEDFELFIKG